MEKLTIQEQIEQFEYELLTLKGTLEMQSPADIKEGKELIAQFYSAITNVMTHAEANGVNPDIIPICLGASLIQMQLKNKDIFFKEM
jgi:hypothetical protein